MSALPFVIWLIGWPLACEIANYFTAKKRTLYNLSTMTERVVSVSALVDFAVWIFIAVKLWGICK